MTETRDQQREVVRALSRDDGRLLWERSWEGSLSVPFFAKANGDWIRATPAWDGERLIVAGMRDRLVCLDGSTGEVVWDVDLMAKYATPLPAFGFVCSPLIVGDHVYVQAAAALVKLDKRTGDIAWRSLEDSGGMWGSAFSSPVLARLAGREQLIVQTREELAGVDPERGDVLWRRKIPAFRGMNILTPTVFGDSLFTSSYGGKSLLLGITGGGDSPVVEERWTNNTTGYMSTPVVVEGHAYLHLRNQRLTCLDLATGESRWTTTPFGKYWSLVAQDDKLLALDETGKLRLVHATPERFDLVDELEVSERECWAHLAVCDDQVFVRDLGAIRVFRWR